MFSKNICKFIPDSSPDTLEIYCFIYESNPEIIKSKTKLSSHRAILVKQGTGMFCFDNKTVEFSPGTLVFGFQDEIFFASPDKDCEYLYINFSGSRSEALFRRFGINKTCRVFYNFDGLIPLWLDSLSRASEINIDLAAESVLLHAFSRLIGISPEQNNLINKIVEFTEKNFTNPDLSLNAIADEISYNSKYISHFFKENMGIGYTEYLRTLRIKYAVSLFDRGIDSVKNVAYLSGFVDPLYFSSVFKKIMGMSPKEYKLRLIKR